MISSSLIHHCLIYIFFLLFLSIIFSPSLYSFTFLTTTAASSLSLLPSFPVSLFWLFLFFILSSLFLPPSLWDVQGQDLILPLQILVGGQACVVRESESEFPTKVVCTLPPGQGLLKSVFLTSGTQLSSPVNFLSYAPPEIHSIRALTCIQGSRDGEGDQDLHVHDCPLSGQGILEVKIIFSILSSVLGSCNLSICRSFNFAFPFFTDLSLISSLH